MSQSSMDGVRAARRGRLSSIVPSYSPPEGHYNEFFIAPGVLRSSWERFGAAVGDLTAEGFEQAQRRIARQIDENGVTYNVYATSDGPGRPWTLDVLPLLIAADEWDGLAQGLQQRARLLNAMAADIYGPQTLL